MRILFIGGTGNISTECAALLHQRGHEIFLLNRGRTAAPAAYRVLPADRHDPRAMRSVTAGLKFDAVIDFIAYEVADVQAAHELFRDNTGQYIFISSTTVYEKPPRRRGALTEDTPLGNPFWDYSQKKVDCEAWLRDRQKQDDFPLTIVRPSHTYSKRWIPTPVSSSSYTFAARMETGKPLYIPDDGENPWTLTAASDFAVGLAGLVGNAAAIGEAFHITGDEVLTWNEVYAEIARALGVKAPNIVKVPTDFICQIAPAETGTLKGDKSNPGVFDNSKIKRLVPDFKTEKPFRVGIRESIDWLRAHPEEQNLDPEIDATCDAVVSAWQNQRAT